MLRPIMTVLVGTALLFACGGRDENVESEASGGEAIDTAAMIAEGAASGQDQPREDAPGVVPSKSITRPCCSSPSRNGSA